MFPILSYSIWFENFCDKEYICAQDRGLAQINTGVLDFSIYRFCEVFIYKGVYIFGVTRIDTEIDRYK